MPVFTIPQHKWEKTTGSNKREAKFTCPYCATMVQSTSEYRIVDTELGSIKYHIYSCKSCCMPISIDLNGKVIPPSQFLPFEDIKHLPELIEKMFNECRKSFSNECYYSVIVVARSLLMHVAVDKGANTNLKFIQYVDYLQNEEYITSRDRIWIDSIRLVGNHFIHDIDDASESDANRLIVFISQLLKNLYELPHMAQEGQLCPQT